MLNDKYKLVNFPACPFSVKNHLNKYLPVVLGRFYDLALEEERRVLDGRVCQVYAR